MCYALPPSHLSHQSASTHGVRFGVGSLRMSSKVEKDDHRESKIETMTKKQQIKLFEDKKVRIAWNDELQEWFFSVADVVLALTDSEDVKQYIKKMRSRDPELNASWGTICTPTRMMATDGKYYKTQAAPMEGIFRIIQSIPSKKAEPFKRWMAEVAAQRLEQMADPELSINQAIADFLYLIQISYLLENQRGFKKRGDSPTTIPQQFQLL